MNKSIEEVRIILNNYKNMINEADYDSDILGELNVYDEIYKQPNRKNCALLPSTAIDKILNILDSDLEK